MSIALNKEGADALREFAQAMPLAISSISESTEKLMNVYQSVAEELGEHDEAFQSMLMYVIAAQKKAAEAIEYLPQNLIRTADAIDAYVAKEVSIS